MTLNHHDSETSTLTYNTETPIATYNTEPSSDEVKTKTPTITYDTEPTSDEVKKTLLGRIGRHSRNIAAALLFAMGTQTVLTGCSPDNEPIPNNQTEININVFNNGANIDISNSPVVKIEGNTLKVEYNTMAQWPENIPSNDVKIIVSPSKYFTSTTEIASGSTLSQDFKGQYLGVKVKEKKALIGELVDKVEEKINTLQNLNYKVDEPIDLTLGGTLNIIEASFTLDGETTNLNTSSAIFPYPGTGTLNVKYQIANGTTRDYSFNINVAPLEYDEVLLDKINISNRFPGYEERNLKEGTWNYFEPILNISAFAADRHKLPNKRQIIAKESYYGAGENNISTSSSYTPDYHGNECYTRMNAISSHTITLCCDGTLDEVYNYVITHPDYIYFISCSLPAGTTSREQLQNSNEKKAIEKLSELPYVTLFKAAGTKTSNVRKVYNESIKNGNHYNTSSINGKNYTNFTVSGKSTRNSNNNYFTPSSNSGLETPAPIGYGPEKKNIVLTTPPGVSSNNSEDSGTSSSYPTASMCGQFGLLAEILISKYNISPNKAKERIVKDFITEQYYQCIDENGNTDNLCLYDLNNNKFYNTEILGINELENIIFDSEYVKLPNEKGRGYKGKGIIFKINGQQYTTTQVNKKTLEEAIGAGIIEERGRDKKIFRKQGGKDEAEITVYAVDPSGKQHTISRKITKEIKQH